MALKFFRPYRKISAILLLYLLVQLLLKYSFQYQLNGTWGRKSSGLYYQKLTFTPDGKYIYRSYQIKTGKSILYKEEEQDYSVRIGFFGPSLYFDAKKSRKSWEIDQDGQRLKSSTWGVGESWYYRVVE